MRGYVLIREIWGDYNAGHCNLNEIMNKYITIVLVVIAFGGFCFELNVISRKQVDLIGVLAMYSSRRRTAVIKYSHIATTGSTGERPYCTTRLYLLK